MTCPSQSLRVVGRLFHAIARGEKTSTIRSREVRISSRSLVRCTEVPLSDAAAVVGRADDWPHAIMLAGMGKSYPEIERWSTV